jgi:hypothetical protein
VWIFGGEAFGQHLPVQTVERMNVMEAAVSALLGFVLLLIEHDFTQALVEGVSLLCFG